MSQQDMQALLRLLTTGRNKVPMLTAMQRVKALQEQGLKSISNIAEASLPTITLAIPDHKAAKSLQSACKAAIKDPTSRKRSSTDDSLSPSSKRHKSTYSLPPALTPAQLEASLSLPAPSKDEEAISRTTLITNRAPLVLAFAVQLLKYTMPEQPLSSTLSLGQAVCSANSRSKAVNLGLEKGKSKQEEEAGWGRGQPRVRVMGREVAVLKRGGYSLEEEGAERERKIQGGGSDSEIPTKEERHVTKEETPSNSNAEPPEITHGSNINQGWTTSKPLSLKSSTFIASSHPITTPRQLSHLLTTLPSYNSTPSPPTHTITAFRILPSSSSSSSQPIEHSNDEGETRGGSFLLNILREHNITNTLLVVRRWYGGIMLGTDRWRLMGECAREALSLRLQVRSLGGEGREREAVWGIDEEASSAVSGGDVGIPIHKPESARNYILKAFASALPSNEEEAEVKGKGKKKRSLKDIEEEKVENLGLLMGALDMLFSSWAKFISREELDHRAWSWYVDVRPEVEAGVKGWGGKGKVKLGRLLDLRRKG